MEGQEEATEEYDGRIKIMPFNMKEDMDEGTSFNEMKYTGAIIAHIFRSF